MKKIRYTLLFMSICIFMASCTKSENKYGLEIPEDVLTLVETYMDAYKLGTGEAIKYTHFENDFKKEAYLESGDKLFDYKIESAEKINDKLFTFTILVKTIQTGDYYLSVYNFVALIDNEWYFINGVGNIPQNLKSNIDESKYTYGV
ncbi:MAG: hypothetical protein GX025_09610 [Clostridiales bacterium]|nr:hypothetical protein [Clostridiales bacterium]